MTGTAVEPRPETSSTSPSDNLPIIAHRGGLELIDAKWELNSGRTVKFRLVATDDAPMLLHPFAEFVRRRGNRVGTRFHVAMSRVGDEHVYYQGEVMLAGGGNPLGQGMWVRFWMDDEADSHPFSGCAGRRRDEPGDMFMAAFVELDSDDEPINQEKRARVERANGGKKGGPLCRWAAQRSHDKLFLQYVSEQVLLPDRKLRPVEWWERKDHVARWIRWMCGVESRADLDNNAKAGEIFHERIRRPYSEWRSTTED
jgi:hypothetical protein